MASPEQQLLSESEDVTDIINDASSIPSEVQVSESQFQELTEDEHDLSQLPDEEAVSETQLHDHNAVSSGSDEGMAVDTDHNVVPYEESVVILTSQEQIQGEDINFVKRPESAGQVDLPTSFIFGKPTRQHMDFKGTPKGPSKPPVADVEENSELVSIPREDIIVQNVEGQVSRKKRKEKKLRRYNTAPEQPDANYITSTSTGNPSTSEGHHSGDIEHERTTVPGPEEQLYQQPEEAYSTPITAVDLDNVTSHPPQRSSSRHKHQIGERDDQGLTSEPVQDQETMYSEQSVTHHSLPRQVKATQSGSQHHNSHNNNGNYGEPDLHQVSDRHGSPRVSKSKPQSRQSQLRRKTAPCAVENVEAKDLLPDVNDYLQIAWLKVTQLKTYYETQYKEKAESLEERECQLLASNKDLQDRLNHVVHEAQTKATTIEEQQAKLKNWAHEFGKLKTSIAGLGKDRDALNKDAITHRHKREQLAEEASANQAERETVLQELNACMESAATLRKKTLTELTESEQNLRDAAVKSKYLEQQLDQTVGMLAEERDRRSRLETRLEQIGAAGLHPDAKMTETVEASKEVLLEKLAEIYKAFRGDHETDGLSYMSMETLAAVQTMTAQSHTAGEDIASTKTAVASLKESIEQQLQASKATDEEQNATAFQSRLDEALSTLKIELHNHEKRLQQLAEQQEHANTLQEKLEQSNERIASVNKEISSAKQREKQLEEDNAKLQARIAALQNHVSPADNSVVELDQAKSALDDKTKAVESARSDLSRKVAELNNLRSINDSLQEQIRTLETRLEETPDSAVDRTLVDEEVKRQVNVKFERLEKETAEHAEKYQAEVRSRFANDLKRLTGEKNRLEKQLGSALEEAKTYKDRIVSMEKDARRPDTSQDREIEKLSALVQSQKQELKTLQEALNGLQNSTESSAILKKDLCALTTQCEDQRKKALQANEEKSSLLKQLEETRSGADAAQLAREQANSELARYRNDTEKSIEVLKKDLAEKQEHIERSTAGYSRFKKSCDDAVLEEKNRSERHIKDLQDRLVEAQSEVQQARESDQKFREEIEQSWQSNVEAHEEKIAEIESKVAKAESEKDGAIQEVERLRREQQKTIDEQLQALTDQLNGALKRANVVEEKLRCQEQLSDATSNGVSKIYVPNIGEHVTPAASLHSTAPTKPRKKIDRNGIPTIEDDPVPAPQELRPDSQRDVPGKSRAHKGSVVEESQNIGGVYDDNTIAYQEPVSMQPPPFMSSESDDMFTRLSGSQQLPEVVAETQSQDALPSFAAFNSNAGPVSSLKAPNDTSTSLSMPAIQDSQHSRNSQYFWPGQHAYSNGKSMHDSSIALWPQPRESFKIFQDSQPGNGLSQSGGLRSEGGRSLHQAETDEFIYRKPSVPPNSASKMVHRDAGTNATKRGGSSTSRTLADQDCASNGSVRGADAKRPLPEYVTKAADTRSSTPEWMQTSTTRRKNSYGTPGNSSSKRRASKTTPGPIADPRLENRNPPERPKRKVSGHIMTGYEPERKKRLSSDATMSMEQSRHFSRQSSTQRSNLPSFPTMPAVPKGLQYQRPSQKAQSHMKTLAGGSSRTKRGVRNPSKRYEADARFMEELRDR